MTTALSDTFTGTNGTNLTAHTMDVGPGWTNVQGTFQIQSNTCQSISATDGDSYVSDSGQADFTVSFDGTCFYTNTGNICTTDLLARWQDANNFWILQDFAANNSYFLYARIGGSYSLRANNTHASSPSGVTHNVALTFNGSAIEAFFNGVSCLTYTDSLYATQTKVGMRTSVNGSPPGASVFDKFLTTYASGGTTVTCDISSFADWQASRQVDAINAVEWQHNKQRDAVGCVDFSASTSRDIAAQAEWLASERADGMVPLQINASLQSDRIMPTEWSGAVSVIADQSTPIEWQATVAVDKQTASEWLGSARADAMAPIEILKTSQKDTAVPADWTGSIARNSIVAVEWTGGIGVSVDALAPIEWGTTVSKSSSVNLNWSAAILSDQAIPFDCTLGVISDQRGSIEWLRAIFGDVVIPGATLVLLKSDSSAPVEFGGASAFIQGNYQIFRVDARGTVWLVAARGTTFKPTLQ